MVFQTRHPSWIILCYIWLLRFAHTGEAQAAKEGKVMGKQSLFWHLFSCLPARASWSAGLPAAPPAPGDPPPPAPRPLNVRAAPGGRVASGLLRDACSPAPGAVRPTGTGFLAQTVQRAWAATQGGGRRCGNGRQAHSPGPRAGQISSSSPLLFLLSPFVSLGVSCGRSWLETGECSL